VLLAARNGLTLAGVAATAGGITAKGGSGAVTATGALTAGTGSSADADHDVLVEGAGLALQGVRASGDIALAATSATGALTTGVLEARRSLKMESVADLAIDASKIGGAPESILSAPGGPARHGLTGARHVSAGHCGVHQQQALKEYGAQVEFHSVEGAGIRHAGEALIKRAAGQLRDMDRVAPARLCRVTGRIDGDAKSHTGRQDISGGAPSLVAQRAEQVLGAMEQHHGEAAAQALDAARDGCLHR
jgi:hypothetical protein